MKEDLLRPLRTKMIGERAFLLVFFFDMMHKGKLKEAHSMKS